MSIVQSDLYPKELPELSFLDGTEAIPVQSVSVIDEKTQSVFHVTPNTIFNWLRGFFLPKVRVVVPKTTNWTPLTSESGVIYVVTAAVGSTITCSVPSGLPIGFEFEIEDTNGITLIFTPHSSEKFRLLGNGVSISTQNSGTDPFRRITVRKITSSVWNLHMDASATIVVS